MRVRFRKNKIRIGVDAVTSYLIFVVFAIGKYVGAKCYTFYSGVSLLDLVENSGVIPSQMQCFQLLVTQKEIESV